MIIFFDGFDYRSTIAPPWTSAGSNLQLTAAAARTGLQGLRGGDLLSYVIDNSKQDYTYTVGFAARNVTKDCYLSFYTRTFQDLQYSFRFNEMARSVEAAKAGDFNNSPYFTDVNAYDPSIFNYFEFQYRMGIAASGYVEIRINGIPMLTLSGFDTRGVTGSSIPSMIDSIRLSIYPTSFHMDDFYLLNSQGSINNNFLGDSRVDTVVPSASGTYTQLIAFGSSQNWQNVDEIPANTSDYNYTDTPGNKDTYKFTALPASITNIAAAQVNIYAAKTSTGTRTVTPIILPSGGSLTLGTERGLSQGYTYYSDIFELDPATNQAWTSSGINNAQFGVLVN